MDRSDLIRKLERGLWISFFVMGAVLGGFFIWLPFAFGSSSGRLLLAAVSSILVLGLIVAGVLFLITRRPVVAWIAVGIEGVFFVLHVVSFGPSFSLIYAAVFLVPVFSALQKARLDSLRRDRARDAP